MSEKTLKEGTTDPRQAATDRVPTTAEIQAARAQQRARHEQAFSVQTDEVDISPLGCALAQVHELPDVRLDKVREVREAIARDQYEDPQKLDIAIDRLLEDLVPVAAE